MLPELLLLVPQERERGEKPYVCQQRRYCQPNAYRKRLYHVVVKRSRVPSKPYSAAENVVNRRLQNETVPERKVLEEIEKLQKGAHLSVCLREWR